MYVYSQRDGGRWEVNIESALLHEAQDSLGKLH